MSEYLEPKKTTKNDANEFQSFSKNYIFNSSNSKNLKTYKKEDLINFSFKKDLISNNNEQKTNDLNIYSKNDQNINKSGHFAKIKEKINKKKDIDFKYINHESIPLRKTLFQENNGGGIKKHKIYENKKDKENKENKENLDNNKYYSTINGNDENCFEKIKTKIKIIHDNKNKNHNQNQIHYKKRRQLNNSVNHKKQNTRIDNNNKNNLYMRKDTNNDNDSDNNARKNRSVKKRVIKVKDNKFLISHNTNAILRNKNLRLANLKYINNNNEAKYISRTLENTIDSNNSIIYSSFEDREKRNKDLLFQKINQINKKLLYFSEYNKKLKIQVKHLSKELSSYENSRSKKKNKTEKCKNSFVRISPYFNKNKSVLYSDIKKMMFWKKYKDSNMVKNRTTLNKSNKSNNKSLCPKNANSFNNTSEFTIKSNKKNNLSKNKNKNTSKNKIDKNDVVKRRIRTNIFDYIQIK